ncbi:MULTISPECIES: hypothetical protein [Filomicrobium]|nr:MULTISPECIES: hypothetical protein [Filomicrobium]
MKPWQKRIRTPMLVFALGLVGITCFGATADARIECRNGSQLVGGNWISTPYCEDQRVAEVAAEYGMRVSADAIRKNPNVKKEVCRLIGQDIRVDMACQTVLPQLRGRGL